MKKKILKHHHIQKAGGHIIVKVILGLVLKIQASLEIILNPLIILKNLNYHQDSPINLILNLNTHQKLHNLNPNHNILVGPKIHPDQVLHINNHSHKILGLAIVVLDLYLKVQDLVNQVIHNQSIKIVAETVVVVEVEKIAIAIAVIVKVMLLKYLNIHLKIKAVVVQENLHILVVIVVVGDNHLLLLNH